MDIRSLKVLMDPLPLSSGALQICVWHLDHPREIRPPIEYDASLDNSYPFAPVNFDFDRSFVRRFGCLLHRLRPRLHGVKDVGIVRFRSLC